MSSQQIDLSLFIPLSTEFRNIHVEVFAGLAGAGEYSLPIDRSCVFDDIGIVGFSSAAVCKIPAVEIAANKPTKMRRFGNEIKGFVGIEFLRQDEALLRPSPRHRGPRQLA